MSAPSVPQANQEQHSERSMLWLARLPAWTRGLDDTVFFPPMGRGEAEAFRKIRWERKDEL